MAERTWTPSQEDAMRLCDKTLLVSAAAGSGKTSVLTERIIRRLLDPEHPADLSRLLVVTFTRAAAAELRSRIGEALSRAMAEHPDDARLPKQMLLLGSAQISTIDSFFQKVVKAHFEQLDLPATFRMADPSELLPLCNEILGDVLEEMYVRRRGDAPQGATPMEEIRRNRFADNLNHLMSNRSDGKLNETLLSFYEQFHSYTDGIRCLSQTAAELRADAGKDFAESTVGASFCAFLTRCFSYYQSELATFSQQILAVDEDRSICGGLLCEELSYCERVLDALSSGVWQTVDVTLRAFPNTRFSNAKNKSAAVKEYQLWRHDVFREEVLELVEQLEANPPDSLPVAMYRTAELLDTLHAIYSEYEQRLLAEKTARGILGFEDVRRALCRLLTTTDGSPTDLAVELSASYDEVYIDEYQDVDELQDRIFALLGKNHRFMVGDIKQSIYGFRGSEPRIFAGYRRRMPLYDRNNGDNAPEYCIFMSDNFRCNAPVIGFANQVCAFLFAACEDSIGYRPEDDLKCSKPPVEGGISYPVQVRTFEPKPRTQNSTSEEDADVEKEEIRFLIDEIRSLLATGRLDNGAPIRSEDIAILVRTKKTGLEITRALREAQLYATCDTASNPLEDPLTMDTVNLLRAIDNPWRDLPLSEALLSPLGGFSLEEIHRIRQAAPEDKALFDAMQAFAASEKDTLLGARVEAWCEQILHWQALAAVQSADRFLRLLFREEWIAPYAKKPALLHLYDKARTYQKNSFCGLFTFLELFVKQAQSHEASSEGFAKEESAVRVMTIHHSKGLEFPIVFVAGCGGKRGADEKKNSILFHRSVGGAAKLYDPLQNEVRGNLLHTEVARVLLEEQAEESIRVLYVALTRARERLYVSGTVSKYWQEKIRFLTPRRPRSILTAGCDMYRILAALYQAPHREELFFQHVHTPYGTYETQTALSVGEEAGVPFPPPTEKPSPTGSATAQRYAQILARAKHFSYPLAYLHGLPTKMAASRLHFATKHRQEAEEATELSAMLSIMNTPPAPFDSLLLDRTTPSAADVGTATHAFLQFCDFARLAAKGIDAELSRLCEERFLAPTAAEILRRDWLEKFLRSDLFVLLRSAREIRREQKFALTLPLSVLTDEIDAVNDATNRLFVQGSIDLVITADNGKRILVDYKSDRIRAEEQQNPKLLHDRFLEAHGSQLACYAIAIEQLFGSLPDVIGIYSLPLGKIVPMDMGKLSVLRMP